ncbi:cell death regulator Aven [Anguilla anguilla]|uniref:cell death regulator Aven n=1 Tax=Anguilla anguilla TaxID=7936 RepID=UPI0015AC95BF|nr:cell death regulator Aven [Anguilla anguilla]
MEPRHNRGRGGSWKRGGGSESHQSSGEHRGRGRGSHHRGRGRRDHYRGRGRGGPVADHHQGRDETDSVDQEDEGFQTFSRRKLESNWDRYEAEEKEKLQEEGPTQRGTDYHALLGSAGDSFTQFRLSEEKDWEADSLSSNQVSAMLVDLQALAQSLQQLPLHVRLNLEVEHIQAATPVELPTVTPKPKQDANLNGLFRPPPAQQGLSGSLGVSCPVRPVLGTAGGTAVPSKAPVASCGTSTPPADELDQELDVLLTLQTSGPDQSQPTPAPEDEMKLPDTSTSQEGEPEAVPPEAEAEAAKPEAEAKRQEVVEDDLEDWLDSMIS